MPRAKNRAITDGPRGVGAQYGPLTCQHAWRYSLEMHSMGLLLLSHMWRHKPYMFAYYQDTVKASVGRLPVEVRVELPLVWVVFMSMMMVEGKVSGAGGAHCHAQLRRSVVRVPGSCPRPRGKTRHHWHQACNGGTLAVKRKPYPPPPPSSSRQHTHTTPSHHTNTHTCTSLPTA